MWKRLGALLVCASLLTAGCVGSVRAGTAQEELDTAEQQAERFAGPDAELVGVIGFESNDTDDEPDEDNDPHDAASQLQDDKLGDGEAPAWVYTYQTSNLTYRVTVTDDGEVIANETEDEVDEDRHPIESWSVTSEEAADTVAEENNTWQVGGEGSGMYSLTKEEAGGDPIWTLIQFQEDGIVVARVNADTGEYLGAEGGGFGFGGFGPGFPFGNGEDNETAEPEKEGGTFSGTLDATSGTAEHTFEVTQEDHPELTVGVQLEGQSAGSSVNVTLEGPDGTIGSTTVSGDSPSGEISQEDPAEGEYTVTLQLEEGVSQDYSGAWCADGTESGDEEVGQACAAVEGEGSDARAALAPTP